MPSCVFCELNKGLVLLDSQHSVLLVNYFPLGVMGLLAISKRHAPSITDLSDEELADVMIMAKKAADKMKRTLHPEGMTLLINEGSIAGQTVPHFHVQIIARGKDDGLENLKRIGKKVPITSQELAKIKDIFLP